MVSQISNGLISVSVAHNGAELTSLFNHATRLEYMWNADPNFWAKTSPVLFPIVGALKDGQFRFQDEVYKLPRHGFAREQAFNLDYADSARLQFSLRHSPETLRVYPFPFELRLIYALREFALDVTYEVVNPSEETMLFSIGAHPAFRVPLVDGTTYFDYFLKFNRVEKAPRWPISAQGLIEERPGVLLDGDSLPLTHDLFYADALVFRDLASNVISIRSHRHSHGIDFAFPDFPFFGIWAARDADFVCLEPWCGIADNVKHNGDLRQKEGIIALDTAETWRRTWSVTTF